MLVSVYSDNFEIITKEFRGINYKYIDGRIKNRKFCAGYCNSSLHRGALTEGMMKKHQCVVKECAKLFQVIDEEKIWR